MDIYPHFLKLNFLVTLKENTENYYLIQLKNLDK